MQREILDINKKESSSSSSSSSSFRKKCIYARCITCVIRITLFGGV